MRIQRETAHKDFIRNLVNRVLHIQNMSWMRPSTVLLMEEKPSHVQSKMLPSVVSHIFQIPQILGGLGHCPLRRKLSISQPFKKKRLAMTSESYRVQDPEDTESEHAHYDMEKNPKCHSENAWGNRTSEGHGAQDTFCLHSSAWCQPP